jgi:MEMO1 family protein
MKDIREPAVAGMFYSSSESKLKSDLKLLLDLYKPEEPIKDIVGIVSPHAGYIYSGKTAAYAFNAVAQKEIDTVVVISPSHREYSPGISIYQGDAYKTPLGIVPVNKDVRDKLTMNSKIIFSGMNGHRSEHAIEVQIPFMQMLFNDFSIVPIVLGDQKSICLNVLAERLADVVTDKTLIVASSDLSHFYTKSYANELDSIVEEHIKNFDYDGLQQDLEEGKCEACGGGAIVVMMKTSDMIERKKSKILSRTDSGDVSGDNLEVVGYLSAAVFS